MALAQKLVQGAQVRFVQKKQGLRQDRLAGEPWQGLAGRVSRAQTWCSSRGSSKATSALLSTMQFPGTNALR